MDGQIDFLSYRTNRCCKTMMENRLSVVGNRHNLRESANHVAGLRIVHPISNDSHEGRKKEKLI
jgi:hypothetical protein